MVRRNKFNARKTIVDGITFHSAREARRWSELCLLEKAGRISNLERQPVFKFSVNGEPVVSRSARYPNGRQLKLVADFRYTDHSRNCIVWEDSKGFRTKEFIVKKAFFEALMPGVYLEEV